MKLKEIAHARTGDKGNRCNICVIPYDTAHYPLLKEKLTAERVKEYYREICLGEVLRYEVENIHALNFVAHGALGGGVSRSLALDNYGKALSAAILGFEIEVPEALVPLLRIRQPA